MSVIPPRDLRSHPYAVTATVLRPGARDTFGNEEPGVEHEVPGCLIAPRASTEPGDFTNTVVTGATLYLPAGTDLKPTDRVLVRGALWEVEGEVGDWGPAGMQVALRRGTG